MKLELVAEAQSEKKHTQDIEAVIVYGDRVFSAADDGIVKIWSAKDLSYIHEFKAHDYAIYHILALGDRLYTASIDLSIKSWQLDTWKLVAILTGQHEQAPRRLATDGEFIYSGDDAGQAFKWTKDGIASGHFDLVEEVWDLHVQNGFIYSIRDRGLTITQMQTGHSKACSVVRTLEGRAPIYITNTDIVMLNSSGKEIDHYHNKPPNFEYITQLKGSDLMLKALTGWKEYLLSAGWNKEVTLWNLKTGTQLSSVHIDGSPNTMAVTNDGLVFVGGEDGYLAMLKAS